MRTMLLLFGGLVSCAYSAAFKMDLSGIWQFALDRQDKGIEQQWFAESLLSVDTIHLPGSLQSQAYGDKPGPSTHWTGDIQQSEWDKDKYDPWRTADNFKMPFWLQPDKYYKGAAWYQKTVTIPTSWKDKHISLMLERPHWDTKVWVDSHSAGSANYLSIPHTYDLTDFLTPGKHTLTIRVDNRTIIDVGNNSHSISDHTQSNWNGIVGKILLQADSLVWIHNVQVYPDLDTKSAGIHIQLRNRTGKAVFGQLRTDVLLGRKNVKSMTNTFACDSTEGSMEYNISLGDDIKIWD